MLTVKQRLFFIGLAVVAGLGVAALAAHFQNTAPSESGGLMAVTTDSFGGPFTLTDHTGKMVTDKDFDGRYRLIYFGFTFCPAICPTELQKMTQALNALERDTAAQITPIFITVDPERDTVEVMNNYVSLFHPSLIGLTGTQEQIDAVLKAYKVYAAKVEDPALTEYTMDHSSFIYFMAPDGRLLHIFKMKDDAATMTDVMTRWLDQAR